MEEKILQLLEGLNAKVDNIESDMSSMKSDMGSMQSDMDSMKSDMGSVKSDMGSMKSEMNSMKSEMGNLKSDVGGLRSEMHSRFDRVDRLLEGIGGQLEHQTSQRIAEGQAISKELINLKLRIFDLETKTM